MASWAGYPNATAPTPRKVSGSFHPPQRCLHRHLPKPRQAHHSRGLCCSPSLLRLTLRSPVYIWVCNCNNGRGLTSAAGRRVSPRFQYGVQSLSGYRFCLIGPYAAARFDKRQKSFSIQVPSSVLPDFPGCRQQKSHTTIIRQLCGKKMTESGKVHSNFTRVIIAFFQETAKRQSS